MRHVSQSSSMTGAGCMTGAGVEVREAEAPVVLAAPVRSDGPAVSGGSASVDVDIEDEEDEEEGEGEARPMADAADRERALAFMRASSLTTPWYMFCHVSYNLCHHHQ